MKQPITEMFIKTFQATQVESGHLVKSFRLDNNLHIPNPNGKGWFEAMIMGMDHTVHGHGQGMAVADVAGIFAKAKVQSFREIKEPN